MPSADLHMFMPSQFPLYALTGVLSAQGDAMTHADRTCLSAQPQGMMARLDSGNWLSPVPTNLLQSVCN